MKFVRENIEDVFKPVDGYMRLYTFHSHPSSSNILRDYKVSSETIKKVLFENKNDDNVIKQWELEHEMDLAYNEQMKNWWKVQVRDAAAGSLRDYTVSNIDELRNLAIDILAKIEHDPDPGDIEEAVNIISTYVQFDEDFENEENFLEESLGDVLVPKSKEDIIKELDKLSVKQKIEAVDSYYWDKGQLLLDLERAGADQWKIMKSFLSNASKEELIDVIMDISPENLIDIFTYYVDDKKHDNIFKKYINSEKESELNDALNDLLIQHTSIIRELEIPDEHDEDWYYPDYPEESETEY